MAKGIYIGVLTDVPIMETTTTQVALSLANLSNFFDVSGETGTRSWTRSDATGGGLKLVPGNFGVNASTAGITLTAKKTLTNVVIKGAYYTERNNDKITLTVAGSVKLNAVSGSSNLTNRWTGTLQTGQTIVLRYAKDSSTSANDERNTYFQVTCDPFTTTSEEIVGYEQQELARRVKSLYVSINGIARKVQKAYIGVEGVARKVFDLGAKKATATVTTSASGDSVSFEVLGVPTAFVCVAKSNVSGGSGYGNVALVSFDGENYRSTSMLSNGSHYTLDGCNAIYDNNQFTIVSDSEMFQAGTYELIYVYGDSPEITTKSVVDVGNAKKAISFTGLAEKPEWFVVQIENDVGTSNGYSRAIAITYDKDRSPAVYGFDVTNTLRALSAWAVSYNNGTLIITSSGTNNGGYFHNPATYTLTAFKAGAQEPGVVVSPKRTITITGTGNATYCYITINGQKYYNGATVQVDDGTEIELFVRRSYGIEGTIWVFNYYVAGTSSSMENRLYNFTVTEDIRIALEYITSSSGDISVAVTRP